MNRFNYKGREVEIKRETETGCSFYCVAIDGRTCPLQATENIAVFYACQHIDKEVGF